MTDKVANEQPDSLIFDMDGTLWDATDLYAESWNRSFKAYGLPNVVTSETIRSLTGQERKVVLDHLMPGFDPLICDRVVRKVEEMTKQLLPELGGKLYEEVCEGIQQLSEYYKLFIVSNCDAGLIRLFMEWAGISGYITDEMAHGINFKPKSYNIKLLMQRYHLGNPVYIGDTEGDRLQSELAGIPFVYANYGFGKCSGYEMEFSEFKILKNYYLNSRI